MKKRTTAETAMAPVARAPCSHETCVRSAIIKQRTDTGWANFCEYHYIQHHQNLAQAWCAEHGLDTVDKKKAFVREKYKSFLSRAVNYPVRVPGEDDA